MSAQKGQMRYDFVIHFVPLVPRSWAFVAVLAFIFVTASLLNKKPISGSTVW